MTVVEDMAATLLAAGTDLGDERRTMLALRACGYSDGQIVVHHDAAVERARELQQRTIHG